MKKVFTGSYIDGCKVDLPTWAGVELTDDQHDRLWSDINETDLIEEAGGFVEIDEAIEDAPPGMNDTYYSVYCSDVEEFKDSIRTVIFARTG